MFRQCCIINCNNISDEKDVAKPLCGSHKYLLDVWTSYKRAEMIINRCMPDITDEYMYRCSAANLRKRASKEYGRDAGHTYRIKLHRSLIDDYCNKLQTIYDLHLLCGNIKQCYYCNVYYIKPRLTRVSKYRPIYLCEECVKCNCGGRYIKMKTCGMFKCSLCCYQYYSKY